MRFIVHLWAGTISLSETTKRTGVGRPQEVPKVLEDRHHLISAQGDDTIMGFILRHPPIQHSQAHQTGRPMGIRTMQATQHATQLVDSSRTINIGTCEYGPICNQIVYDRFDLEPEASVYSNQYTSKQISSI